jgi:hypothetical protein
MEIKRSYLRNIIAFYFVLKLPTIRTYGEALAFWSNKFKSSELKAVLQLAGELAKSHKIGLDRPRDKPAALVALAAYIKRVDLKLRKKFKNTSKDSARCARAAIALHAPSTNVEEGFEQFMEKFEDVQSCRAACRIDRFFLDRYKKEVQSYLDLASTLPDNSETQGFLRIAEQLTEIRKTSGSVCSCKQCERIGDAVVALDAERVMQLEHTDHSFDYLCPAIKQPHLKHPSEVAVVKKGSSTPSSDDDDE